MPQRYNTTPVYLLAQDLSSSKRGLILSRKGLESRFHGLFVRLEGLEPGIQGLHQELVGLGSYLACLELTNKPGTWLYSVVTAGLHGVCDGMPSPLYSSTFSDQASGWAT